MVTTGPICDFYNRPHRHITRLVCSCAASWRTTGETGLILRTSEQLDPEQREQVANRRFSCTEIATAFGVPEEMITSTSNAKFDVMAGARLNFIENRVVPLCRRLEAAEHDTIAALDPKARGWFDVEDHPVLAAARRDRLSAAREGFAMGVPFNELNASLDLGFKPLPWGDVGYVPTNVVRADGTGKTGAGAS